MINNSPKKGQSGSSEAMWRIMKYGIWFNSINVMGSIKGYAKS